MAPRTSGRRPTTTPSTCCCGRCAAWTGRCSSPWTASRCSTTGASTPGGAHTDRGYHQAVIQPEGLDLTLTLTSDIRIGLEGPSARARTLLQGGRHPLLRAVLGQPHAAGELRGGLPAPGVDRAPLAALAGPGQLPRPPLAQPPRPQRAHAQGPDVRADRRDRRRGDHLAAGDAGRRAELGLPLHLDPRRDVRAVGPVHPRLRVGGQRLLRLHRRPGRTRPAATCRSSTASTAGATSTSRCSTT